MPKKKADEPAAPESEERRSDDQEAALEQAAASGELPPIDRRIASTVFNYTGFDTAEAVESWLRNAMDVLGDAAILEAAYPGTQLTKTKNGWQMQLVGEGGTVLHLSGPTFSQALGDHGQQVVHQHAVISKQEVGG